MAQTSSRFTIVGPEGVQPGICVIPAKERRCWDVRSADSVSIDQGIGVEPMKGEATVSPLATTTYTLTATGPGGTTTSTTTVFVDAVIGVTITGISPDHSSTAGNLLISIYGTGFRPGAAVLVGGAPGRDVVFLRPDMLEVRTPSHPPGVVDVSVINPDGESFTLPGSLTYVSQVFDPNGDGLLDSADLTTLMNAVFGGSAAHRTNDANADGLLTPADAWSIQVTTEGVGPFAILRVRRAAGLDIVPVYEAQHGGGASAAYLVLLDEAEASRVFTPARKAVVVEVEVKSTSGFLRLNLAGSTTMLMDGRGTTAASQASGTLVLTGVTVSNEGSRRRAVAH